MLITYVLYNVLFVYSCCWFCSKLFFVVKKYWLILFGMRNGGDVGKIFERMFVVLTFLLKWTRFCGGDEVERVVLCLNIVDVIVLRWFGERGFKQGIWLFMHPNQQRELLCAGSSTPFSPQFFLEVKKKNYTRGPGVAKDPPFLEALLQKSSKPSCDNTPLLKTLVYTPCFFPSQSFLRFTPTRLVSDGSESPLLCILRMFQRAPKPLGWCFA